MDDADLHVLKRADRWRQDRRHVVPGKIIRTWVSGPLPVGSRVFARGDGQVVGSVSVGCMKDDPDDRVRFSAVARRRAEPRRDGLRAGDVPRYGRLCGGTIEPVPEPIGRCSTFRAFVERLEAGIDSLPVLDLATGSVTHMDVTNPGMVLCDERTLIVSYGLAWHMRLIGAGHLTDGLADMATAVGVPVSVCDQHKESSDGWTVKGTTGARPVPYDKVVGLDRDVHTAVIGLLHGCKLVDHALLNPLGSEAFFVGAIVSRSDTAARREWLLQFGLTVVQVDRLRTSVGIRIDAGSPLKNALSIAADVDMIAAEHGYAEHLPVPLREDRSVQSECFR